MLNKIVVMGRLTRDPELRYTGNNIPVVSFTVAVDRDFTGKDKEKQTDFINCAAWRNTAEYVSKFFTKGGLVVVSGSLHSRKWEKDGGYGFEVMSMADVLEHAKRYSKSYGSGPWQTNFDEMAKKTVLKRCLKYAPLKSEFVRGVTQDETVKTKIDEDMYSVPDETVYADFVEVDESTGEVIGDAQ